MIYKTLHRKLEIEQHEQGERMRSRRVGNPCYMFGKLFTSIFFDDKQIEK